MTEIILLSVTIALLIAVLLVVILKKNPTSSPLAQDEIRKNLEATKDALLNSFHQTILQFNDSVNQKLLDTSTASNQTIGDFRVKINAELNLFNEKINQRMIDEFTKLNEQVDKKMTGINEKVEQRLTQGFTATNETFQNIITRMATIDKAQTNIEKLSTEMVSLQSILSNNQARGVFGEFQLNQILYASYGDNPKLFQTQYSIKEAKGSKEAVRADAVIFMPPPHHLICIDSKFPFANYVRLFGDKLQDQEEEKLLSAFAADVKKHITDIAAKYIIEGVTADFACMFVPSDGILTLLHSRLPNVIEWASLKNIVILSPTLTIPLLTSFKAIIFDYERNKNATEIRNQLKLLNRDFIKFSESWSKLNENIRRLGEQSGQVDNRVHQITSKFDQIKLTNFEQITEEE